MAYKTQKSWSKQNFSNFKTHTQIVNFTLLNELVIDFNKFLGILRITCYCMKFIKQKQTK